MIRNKFEIIDQFNIAFEALNSSTPYLRIMGERLYATKYRERRASREQIAHLISAVATQMIGNREELHSFESAQALEKFHTHYQLFLQKFIHPSLTTRCLNTISCVWVFHNSSRNKNKQNQEKKSSLETEALDKLKKAYHASLNHPWLDTLIVTELTKNSESTKVHPAVLAALRSSMALLNSENRSRWIDIIHHEIALSSTILEEEKIQYQNQIKSSFDQKNETLMNLISMKCLVNSLEGPSKKSGHSTKSKMVHFAIRPRSSSIPTSHR